MSSVVFVKKQGKRFFAKYCDIMGEERIKKEID